MYKGEKSLDSIVFIIGYYTLGFKKKKMTCPSNKQEEPNLHGNSACKKRQHCDLLHPLKIRACGVYFSFSNQHITVGATPISLLIEEGNWADSDCLDREWLEVGAVGLVCK